MVSYTELAEQLVVPLCTGGCGTDADHQRGQWLLGYLHWQERALRKTSLRNFVWIASAGINGAYVRPSWMRYWQRVLWAKRALHTAHTRLPAEAWNEQRATLRALMALPRDEQFDPPEYVLAEAHKAARRWAQRFAPAVDPDERADV